MKIIKFTLKINCILVMEVYMMENGHMMLLMDLGHISLKMVLNIKGGGKMI